MIIGTSPNGVFKVDTSTEEVEWLLKGNFFGVAIRNLDDIIKGFSELYLAERVTTGTKLHVCGIEENKVASISFKIWMLEEEYDVHQICLFHHKVLLTNTAHNTLSCFDVNNESNWSLFVLDKGVYYSEDRNHVNAVCVTEDDVLNIGRNNKGAKESEVEIRYSSDKPDKLIKLNGVYHSHDLEPYNDDILISASHQGFIYSLNKKEPLFYTDKDSWVRGICISTNGIWCGYSAVSPRTSRQDTTLKNSINLFSHDDFKHIKQIEIPRAGQINDLLCI